MFVVDDILVSDEIALEPFVCNFGACLGACCVQGDSGAPLDASELPLLDEAAAAAAVRKYMSRDAVAIVDTDGCWETLGDDRYATRCLDSGECIFVTYEGDVARCSIQKAYERGRASFPKPVSCHLFPIRVENYGTYEVINYEWVAICEPARNAGLHSKMYLTEFLREPLTRKYGDEWYEKLLNACKERRSTLSRHPQN